MTAASFRIRLGGFGEALVSGAMVVFAFATVIAWYYLGRQTFKYLTRRLWHGRLGGETAEQLYMILYLLAVFAGCVCRLEMVWLVSDLWNGLMAYPNLLALLLLSGQVNYPEVKRPIDKRRKNEYTESVKRE